MPEDARTITDLLRRIGAGDRGGLDELIGLLYSTLKRMCQYHLGRLPAGSLTPTALLNELYIDLADRFPDLANRKKFFAYAHAAIRHLAINSLRRADAVKRGGDQQEVSLEQVAHPADLREDAEATLFVFEVMASIEEQDPELAEIVKLRVFDGLSERAIAEDLGLSRRRVREQWDTARRLLVHLVGVDRRK